MNRWLRRSAVLTLLALAMMVWSVLRPTPLPVMLAMSFGQLIGTVAFAIYGWIVFVDLRRVRRAARLGATLEAEERLVARVATEAAAMATAATAVAAAAVAVAEQAAATETAAAEPAAAIDPAPAPKDHP